LEKKKYKYSDWWNGTTYLDTCPTFSNRGENIGIKASLSDFVKNDANKIVKKQQELFEKESKKRLEIFIKQFKDRYKNSEAKKTYLRREIADINKIISSKSGLSPRFYNWNPGIKREDLDDMRIFVNEQIIKGEKYYAFMHSPNYRFQNKNKVPSGVYARACWDYLKWIEKNIEMPSKKQPKVQMDDSKLDVPKKESVPVIALLHVYKNSPINRDNCKEIASRFGYDSKNSGEGLFQDYTKYSKHSNRVGINDNSNRKNENKRSLLLKVIKLLKGNNKKQAQLDLLKLESNMHKVRE
jgi:hypothetical protein